MNTQELMQEDLNKAMRLLAEIYQSLSQDYCRGDYENDYLCNKIGEFLGLDEE